MAVAGFFGKYLRAYFLISRTVAFRTRHGELAANGEFYSILRCRVFLSRKLRGEFFFLLSIIYAYVQENRDANLQLLNNFVYKCLAKKYKTKGKREKKREHY